jgi:hypothetical protein
VPKVFCTECGARALAACNCGVAYIPANIAAAIAVAEHPEKSDRAISILTGIARTTLQRARKSTGPSGPVDKRIGIDGKTRRLPRHANPMPAELKHQPLAIEVLERLTPLMDALKREGKYHESGMSPTACEVCASEWTIDEGNLKENVIEAVRKTARAWGVLLDKILVAAAAAARTVDHDKPETRIMCEEVLRHDLAAAPDPRISAAAMSPIEEV